MLIILLHKMSNQDWNHHDGIDTLIQVSSNKIHVYFDRTNRIPGTSHLFLEMFFLSGLEYMTNCACDSCPATIECVIYFIAIFVDL
jgi:hypothetical protein